MDPDEILQAYVVRTLISHVKIGAPCAKGAQNGGENGGSFFCNGYNELAFPSNGTDRHKIRAKNVNRYAVLNLN